jgi:hypothetical protein
MAHAGMFIGWVSGGLLYTLLGLADCLAGCLSGDLAGDLTADLAGDLAG